MAVEKTWGVFATIAIAVLAFGLGQGAAAASLSLLMGPSALGQGLNAGAAVTLVTVVANAVVVVTLVLAARVCGPAAAYLGLDRPPLRMVLFGLACVVSLIVLADGATWLTGRDLVPPVQLVMVRSAQAEGVLPLLLVALVLVAPVGEELLFRGFLFRGCARSEIGARITIVAAAIAFAALHVQYDWFGMALVLLAGLLFGWMRWISGSTTLAILLHVVLNLAGVTETLFTAW
ncbi:Abortive infection protein [Rhodovulum sp. PH10]|uniref:CPBP family intramembrane glutamic endopeptidase n=1 Tax=Rhodovulum sp. PH10 TaxID=1187851 RepID=UPI00027C2918|nr:CPBP family intramembrane glutamic endopeptidase [Rhodovulum sp. PH10]EJW11658.1 Abortive infection protein [Rhodovulum sp. PH10]